MRGFQVHTWGLCLIFAVAGCANVSAVPVKPGSPVAGIRYYDVKPLLVVSGESVTPIIVPNYNRGYALKFSTFLAKHDFEATFQSGFLTTIKSHQDTTALPIALVELVKAAVSSGNQIGDAFANKAGGTGDRFGIYDIVFDDEGNIVGLKQLLVDTTLMKVPPAGGTTAPPPPPGGSSTGGRVNVN